MRKTLTITDVTEMRDDEVCIAGIDDVGFCVRPVVPGGVRLHHLYNRGSAVVVPGRNVEFDLFEAKIEPPHIEDERFFPSSIVDKGRRTPPEWEEVLAASCSADVSEVFDGHIVGGRYVPPRTQTRSLGTVEGVAVEYVRIFDDPDRRRYRISFQDASGIEVRGQAGQRPDIQSDDVTLARCHRGPDRGRGVLDGRATLSGSNLP